MRKNIIVTGCTKGLGLQICLKLIEKNFNVYGISRKLSIEYKKLIELYPDQVFFFSYDLSNSYDIKSEIFKKYIPNSLEIHGFVNNAAKAYDDIVTNININRLENMFKINVYSPLLMSKYVIRNMIFNRVKGSLINISSISAHTGYKGLAMYAASKSALEGFSKNVSREWGEKGIRSNCIVAGFMETSMSSTLSTELKKRIFNRTSLKTPTDLNSVASTVLFLLSDDSSSITGQNINVDSGTI